jgi:hypothetical protein
MSKLRPRAHGKVTGEIDASALESGVVQKGLAAELESPPPWDVVHAYLTAGEHGAWVESFAARSRAFADVLAALRNDQVEREEEARPRAEATRLRKRP